MGPITTFTPEEIAILTKRPSQVVREKIAATGSKEALEAFDSFVTNNTGNHDMFITWITYAMSAAYNGGAGDLLKEYMLDMFRPFTVPNEFWDLPFKQRALISMSGFRDCHDTEIEFIGEDDEKLCFKMVECGSGGKLCKMGLYEPEGKCSLCSACDYTAGIDKFPIYCIHSPLFSIACGDKYPSHVWDFQENIGPQACIISCYKDPTKIPDKYFERVGLKKPQR